jgi:hypothetical protein
MENRENN